ncbi:TIM barrel protein [candidate division KSB1 bacterium]|nr:TIM barrel protein [candidate division KSB1 bacterium]
MSQFKFSAGPWNVHEGADAFGPKVRPSIPIAEKISTFKDIGLDAVQFHDDDAVPEMNNLSDKQIIETAKEMKNLLDSHDLAAEFVAPRLWEDSRTVDGAFTSNSKSDRDYAIWRAFRSIDIARALGTDKIVLWLAREGTLCYESKDPVEGPKHIIDAINKMLAYDQGIKILIETKPNEPIDRSYCPTMGHAMAVSSATNDPSRVGGLLETAHAVLAGLDPASEIAFALAFGKLWSVHLNDQNGLKYDQDKTFGVENLRQAFNQIRVLVDYNYGQNGEYIGLDVKAMRTQKVEVSYRHLENSMKIVKMLEAKAKKFDRDFQKKCVAARDYEALEMYVLELLMSS